MIVYDECNIDLHDPLHEQMFELQEDLLQIKYPGNYVIDVGWYPALDPSGVFIMYVIKDSNWDAPLYKVVTDVHNVKKELQNVVNRIISMQP